MILIWFVIRFALHWICLFFLFYFVFVFLSKFVFENFFRKFSFWTQDMFGFWLVFGLISGLDFLFGIRDLRIGIYFDLIFWFGMMFVCLVLIYDLVLDIVYILVGILWLFWGLCSYFVFAFCVYLDFSFGPCLGLCLCFSLDGFRFGLWVKLV